MRKHLVIALVVVVGCANEPIVDKRGVNHVKYEKDLAECRAYADEVNTPAEGAKRGAIGVAVGGTIGAIVGDGHSAGKGAGIGATVGATQGAERAGHRKERVLYRCLEGRGYRVLG